MLDDRTENNWSILHYTVNYIDSPAILRYIFKMIARKELYLASVKEPPGISPA
jgi:hypothetical protein